MFERGNGDVLVAVWLAGEAVDDASREHAADIRLPGVEFTAAQALDTLNGIRHDLQAIPAEGTLENVRVRDWPLVLVLSIT